MVSGMSPTRRIGALLALSLVAAACHEPLIDLGGYGGDSCAESYYPRIAWECDSPSGCCFGDADAGSPGPDAGPTTSADAGRKKGSPSGADGAAD